MDTNGATQIVQEHILIAGAVVVGLILFTFWASAWGDDEEDMRE